MTALIVMLPLIVVVEISLQLHQSFSKILSCHQGWAHSCIINQEYPLSGWQEFEGM
jgi:hypothetical protein